MLVAVGTGSGSLDLVTARREEQMQLMRGDQPLKPRIRGPLDLPHVRPRATVEAEDDGFYTIMINDNAPHSLIAPMTGVEQNA
ncbi:hypothetical protein [Streptomyces sp. NPDC050988]|uniref:hypothetical protein n=1 Tax=Streptomyces sp. NPDC050988 TaxID=3365637 RepID=UPI0037AC8744